jgi:hypothetical protein
MQPPSVAFANGFTQRSQTIVTLAEIYRLCSHNKDLHRRTTVDHNAPMISVMRIAGVSAPSGSSPAFEQFNVGQIDGAAGTTSSGLGSSICIGHKIHAIQANKLLFVRAIRRQSETLQNKSYRLATPLTVAPSISVSKQLCLESVTGQRRLPSELRGIPLARNLVREASIERNLSTHEGRNRISTNEAVLWVQPALLLKA